MFNFSYFDLRSWISHRSLQKITVCLKNMGAFTVLWIRVRSDRHNFGGSGSASRTCRSGAGSGSVSISIKCKVKLCFHKISALITRINWPYLRFLKQLWIVCYHLTQHSEVLLYKYVSIRSRRNKQSSSFVFLLRRVRSRKIKIWLANPVQICKTRQRWTE